jgi:hypothetical protein
MKLRFVARLIALLLCSQLGACAFIRSQWQSTSRLPPSVSTPPPPNQPSATSGEPTEEQENPAVPAKPATASVPVKPASAPASTLNVTIQDSDADHRRAQALLEQADARLAQVDRSTLTADSTAVFGQASVLADAARKAMMQRDYLAASGLARKSLLLTGQLSSSSAPPKGNGGD